MIKKKPAKRCILLLEVLIAFALVALCIFPLMAPHVFMLKSQYAFNSKIALDQVAGKLYTHILEKAYRREIPWQAIEQKQVFPIDEGMLVKLGLGSKFAYKGHYSLSITRSKGKESPLSANVITADIVLIPKTLSDATEEERKNGQSTYKYKFFAAHVKEAPPTDTNEVKTPSRHTP